MSSSNSLDLDLLLALQLSAELNGPATHTDAVGSDEALSRRLQAQLDQEALDPRLGDTPSPIPARETRKPNHSRRLKTFYNDMYGDNANYVREYVDICFEGKLQNFLSSNTDTNFHIVQNIRAVLILLEPTTVYVGKVFNKVSDKVKCAIARNAKELHKFLRCFETSQIFSFLYLPEIDQLTIIKNLDILNRLNEEEEEENNYSNLQEVIDDLAKIDGEESASPLSMRSTSSSPMGTIDTAEESEDENDGEPPPALTEKAPQRLVAASDSTSTTPLLSTCNTDTKSGVLESKESGPPEEGKPGSFTNPFT